jgi:hypothetical protein
MVAVETCDSVAMACGVRDIEKQLRSGWVAAHLASGGDRVKCSAQNLPVLPAISPPIITPYHGDAY